MNAREPLPAVSHLRYRAPHWSADDWGFNALFAVLLILGYFTTLWLNGIRILPPVQKIERTPAKVTTMILEPVVPKPVVEPERPKPKPPEPQKVKPGPKVPKIAKAPPAVSAPGTPKKVPEIKKPPKDLSKLVVKKGLLGLLSEQQTDASLRGFTPTDKRVPADNLALALAKPDKVRRKEDDLLGPGNYVDVAKKGADVGYLINATKLPKTINRDSLEVIAGEDVDIPVEVLGTGEQTGGRSASDVSKWVAKFLGGLRYLYNRELRTRPELQGKLVVTFEITPAGQVENARMVSTTLGSPGLNRQLVARIETWKFPAINEDVTVTVTYPFLFLPPT
ncbi:MAG: energy transducer TonB [Myxococcales bacterium]|nr:energy transducer TonB [Myxococcales bacterium]